MNSLVMGVIGDQLAALYVAWRGMRDDVRVSIDAQDLNGTSIRVRG